ncbi:chaplin [Streptomyces sp. NPDC047108]|uniref:chaplin n=1 Tax=Streptomyces sp. NPDC047108 TaxID=3155025 RepID=UPI0033C8EBDB
MRKVARKSLITVAAASGVLAVTGGYAYADADAQGVARNSPGVGSGNTVQVPVHVPINVCGNTVNVVGLLNPVAGNSCANISRGNDGSNGGGSGSSAQGGSSNSPGVISGNSVQVPVEVPVNACGNSIGAGAGNAVTGNKCANASDDKPDEPGNPGEPEEPNEPSNPSEPDDEDKPTPGKPGDEGGSEVKPSTEHKPQGSSVKGTEELAETGAGTLAATGAASAAMLLGGVVLYRRARTASRS